MGKIFTALWGGKRAKSEESSQQESGNRAFDQINSNFGAPAFDLFNRGSQRLSDELSGGFEGFKKNIGFDFFEKMGLDRVAGQSSGRGVFQSGDAMMKLADYQNNIGKAAYGDYMSQVNNQANLGLGAAGLVSDAGKYAKGSSKGYSKSRDDGDGIFGKFLAAAAAGGGGG